MKKALAGLLILLCLVPLLRAENLKEPLDWAVILFAIRKLEPQKDLKLYPQQAKKFIPLVKKLKETVKSSAGFKRAINSVLSEAQLSYLLKLEKAEGLTLEPYLLALSQKPPATALIDLVLEKLKTKAQTLKSEQLPQNFPQKKKELHILSDLLLGLLYLEKEKQLSLSPQQAGVISYFLKEARLQLAGEYQLSRQLENLLNSAQLDYLYRNQEELILATDELPVVPVKGKKGWESQAELPLIDQSLEFLQKKVKE